MQPHFAHAALDADYAVRLRILPQASRERCGVEVITIGIQRQHRLPIRQRARESSLPGCDGGDRVVRKLPAQAQLLQSQPVMVKGQCIQSMNRTPSLKVAPLRCMSSCSPMPSSLFSR